MKFTGISSEINFIILVLTLFACSPDKKEIEIEPKEQFSFLAQLDLPGDVYDLCGFTLNDKEFVIVASRSSNTEQGGTTIIDISSPDNPSIVSTIQVQGVNVKVWKNYVYIAQGSNSEGATPSQIFDISDPSNPVFVGTFPAFHNIFIDELGYLFVTGYFGNSAIPNSDGGLGVSIYDLNPNPREPKLIWTSPTNESSVVPAHDISVIRNKLYTFNTSRSKIEIFDIKDRNSPVFLGKYQFKNGVKVHSGWVTQNDQYLYVCLEESEDSAVDVIILDISNPASPVEVGSIHDFENTVHNLYIIDNYAYTSFYNAGLRIYNVTNPIKPELVYDHDTNETFQGTGAFGVYPFSPNGYISVSDWDKGLFIFRKN